MGVFLLSGSSLLESCNQVVGIASRRCSGVAGDCHFGHYIDLLAFCQRVFANIFSGTPKKIGFWIPKAIEPTSYTLVGSTFSVQFQ